MTFDLICYTNYIVDVYLSNLKILKIYNRFMEGYMPKVLVIVESPAKAKTIEKFLGKDYKVMASVGHVRDLPKSKMGINIEENFEPKYITIRGKGKVLKELRRQAKKVDKVYLATDPDREGEAIAWHLTYSLKLNREEKCRITFQEITKDAVREAAQNPREINLDLVDAQQARRLLDRLVGYSISPILWNKVRRGLSAGRVQSVATRIICDREEEINAFEPEEYWELTADTVGGDPKEKDQLKLKKKDNKKLKISSKEEMDNVLSELKGNPIEVTDIKTSIYNRKPYAPFTTSTLQQEASNKLGFSTKKTMGVAQSLYEGVKLKGGETTGLITYMRTDSTRISDKAKNEVSKFIKEEYSDKYLKTSKKSKKKKSKNVQDAHEAIRPTNVFNAPGKVKSSLNKDQYRLYRLIWKRFVASNMVNAKFERVKVKAKNGAYTFTTSGQILKFDGFLKVYTYVNTSDNRLPAYQEGEELEVLSYTPEQKFTQPPSRYSEATLVKMLKEKGIGRPSTYSPTISTILSRNYVEKESRYLKPTELGILINDIMKNHFSQIVDLDFTAEIEKEFDLVENGNEDWKKVIAEFYKPFEKDLKSAEKNIKKVDMTEETDEVCEKCGSPMVIKYGRYGKFMACSAYPDCKNTKPILNKIGVECPDCEDGEIIKRKSKRKRTFYGCTNYPDCKFVSWSQPVDEECPECGSILTVRNNKKSKVYMCSSKECSYKRKEKK